MTTPGSKPVFGGAKCPLCDSAERARTRTHPWLIAELSESYCVLGDNQGSKGWCVLIAKEHADHLAEWPMERQQRLWHDVASVAAAQRAVFGPVRINYECLGNQVHHVHWHVIPRHADDPMPRSAVWLWPEAQQRGAMSPGDRAALAASLAAQIRTGAD